MAELGVDVLLLSVGPDLPYLTATRPCRSSGSRCSCSRARATPRSSCPRLEAPRVVERPDVFGAAGLGRDRRPDRHRGRPRRAGRTAVAIGDRTWARFLVDLQGALPAARFGPGRRGGRPAAGPQGRGRGRRAARGPGPPPTASPPALQTGDIPLVGRTEAEVSADLGRRLLAEGHHRVNFAIVAAGANAASPHHEPGDRVIAEGEVVLCDFGGTMLGDDGVGYCSDITRCVHLGEPAERAGRGLRRAARRAAGRGGGRGASARRARRSTPPPAGSSPPPGWGEQFIHRTGHGIGIEEHEDPYIVSGNAHAPSSPATPSRSSPASTCRGRFGFRLEDIVVAADDGPDPLNRADHDLALALSRASRRRDPPRRRHRPAAVGHRRPAVPAGSPPAAAMVGLGYGWLLRGTYGADRRRRAPYVGLRYGDGVPVREAASIGVVLATGAALAVSVVRRKAGVAGERERVEQRQRPHHRDDRHRAEPHRRRRAPCRSSRRSSTWSRRRIGARRARRRRHRRRRSRRRCRWPGWSSGPLFLGAVSDAMLLGHWYLVQPGMARAARCSSSSAGSGWCGRSRWS